MKKIYSILALTLALLLALSGCGAASAPRDADMSFTGENSAAQAETAPSSDSDAPGLGAAELPQSTASFSDKIIYSAYAEIETRAFDDSVAGVSDLIKRFGGFLESSAVTGQDYNGGASGRTASFTLRVPSDKFGAFTGALSELGSVIYSTTDAQNITREYNDTQARLDAYNIEYERLLAMLEKAQTVEEMLSIESRLSEVRGNIQSLSNTLSGWDSLLSYSTVQLQLTQVVEYTPLPEQGYWQSVWSGFLSSLKGVGSFFKGALRFLISALPVLVLLGAAGVAAWLIIRGARRRRTGKPLPPREARDQDKNSE
jgi:hypothetical protein